MRVLIAGDTHGNAKWLREYIYPVAMTTGAEAIVVLGDFGAWEHTPAGVVFMDDVNEMAFDSGIPLYWLHGNHDKHSHTVEHYRDQEMLGGFLACRDRVFYIPQGNTWTWGGVPFRAFGGAYSIDKVWRVQREQENYLRDLRQTQTEAREFGRPANAIASTAGTLWFPEEEMTDAQMTEMLRVDSARKQIVLSHDKPYSAIPPWNRKDLPGCVPNQLRLERALRAHRPTYWVHGHLHYHYQHTITGESWKSTVIGLEPDIDAAEPGWKEAHTWLLADCENAKLTVKLGSQVHLDVDVMQEAMMAMG